MPIRLSGDDSVRLHTQTSTMPAHTIAVVVLEASDQLSHERLHRLVASSLPELVRFRSRLVSKALGLGQPVWAEIEDYDPALQIHRAAVRAPGGQREFAELIARLSAARPTGLQRLWEAWSIEGLAGGRWALAVKMSPALSEGGNAAASIWQRLLTSAPQRTRPINSPAETSLGSRPSMGELVTDVLTEILENQVTGVWLVAATAARVLQTVHRRLRGTEGTDPAAPAVPSRVEPLGHNRFNAPLTRRRAVSFTSVRLSDVAEVSNAFGGSTANVLLAACALSLRAWLLRYDSVPGGPLLMQVPLALPACDPAASDSPLTVGLVRLPVHLDDPVQVLSNLHTATERLSIAHNHNGEAPHPVFDLATITSLIPPLVTQTGAQLHKMLGLDRWLAPARHGSVSYIPGNTAAAYCLGAKVVSMQTAAPLLDRRGLTITGTSYNDVMNVCVCVCPDNVPAVDDIACGIGESVQRLVRAAQESPRGQGPSIVSEMASHVDKRPQLRRY